MITQGWSLKPNSTTECFPMSTGQLYSALACADSSCGPTDWAIATQHTHYKFIKPEFQSVTTTIEEHQASGHRAASLHKPTTNFLVKCSLQDRKRHTCPPGSLNDSGDSLLQQLSCTFQAFHMLKALIIPCSTANNLIFFQIIYEMALRWTISVLYPQNKCATQWTVRETAGSARMWEVCGVVAGGCCFCCFSSSELGWVSWSSCSKQSAIYFQALSLIPAGNLLAWWPMKT